MVRRLLYLNGLSILCVILYHAVGMTYVAMFDWAPRLLGAPASSGSLSYLTLRTIEQIVIFCIPAFLFVSGYFVAALTGKTRLAPAWPQILARVRGLLIPYLIWSLVAMVLTTVFDGKPPGLGAIAVNLLTGRSNEVLYFVPLLVQYYLLSPLLVPLARRNWRLFLFVAAVIQLIVQLLPQLVLWGSDIPGLTRLLAFVPKWFFLSRLFWFCLGIVFGFHLQEFKAALYPLRWLLLIVVLLSIPVGVWEWETYFRTSGEVWLASRETLLDTIYSLAMILVFFAFADVKLPLTRAMENLGKDSYGIYLVHAFFIVYTAKIIYRLVPALFAQELVYLVLLIVVGLVGSVALLRLVAPSPARRFYSYLFG